MSITVDSHIHTTFSGDAVDNMEDMVKSAIAKGFSIITFNDHVEFNKYDDSFLMFDYKKYSAEIERLRDKYSDKIQILKGMEFSEPYNFPKEYEKLLQEDFDMVMASVHYLTINIGLHWTGGGSSFTDYGKDELYRVYYNDMMKMIKLGGFDIVGHFDHPKRYLMASGGDDEIIQSLISEIIKRDYAIEINTSSLRKGYPETCPDDKILSKYYHAGGRKITLGSDAHNINDIGMDFTYAENLINKYDFDLGYYKNRKYIKI